MKVTKLRGSKTVRYRPSYISECWGRRWGHFDARFGFRGSSYPKTVIFVFFPTFPTDL